MLYTIGSNGSIRSEGNKKKSKRQPKRDTSKVNKIKDTVVEVELVTDVSKDIFSEEFTESFTDISTPSDKSKEETETPKKARVKKTSSSKGKKRQSSKSLKSKQSSGVSDSSLLDSKYVDTVATRKKKTKNNIDTSIELPKVSKAEKIAYCNSVYGKGNWEFMTYDEVRAELSRSLL